MSYEFYNPSPTGARIGDCVIRAICKALNQTWEHTYVALCIQGFSMYDLPNADSVWGEYLRSQGFQRHIIPNTCPDCYNIWDFANEHPKGTFVLGTGSTHQTRNRDVLSIRWLTNSRTNQNGSNPRCFWILHRGSFCPFMREEFI